ncbi:hypothetical protein PIB30_076622 [Stylosanthes scabra]|uniref:Uncharacterized protein n=1 Tax=Stylosanthes scabra TaxID=79078 RepID=A0ABU6UPQ5_9FABA|nr:hypothetical protein [Stylosanthes scabra]
MQNTRLSKLSLLPFRLLNLFRARIDSRMRGIDSMEPYKELTAPGGIPIDSKGIRIDWNPHKTFEINSVDI